MRRIFLFPILGSLFLAGSLVAQTHYFPQKTFGDDPQLDQLVSHWYSGQLRALGEPSLLQLSKIPVAESYRFLWLRTFHHPVAVQVNVNPDGTATLITKIADAAGGYSPGTLIEHTVQSLSTEETQKLVAKINTSGFWQLPSYDRERAGNDGSEWVVEAAAHGKYHLVSDWSPKDGPIHDLGIMFLFELAKIKVPKNEIY